MSSPQPGPPKRPSRVLVADDDPSFRKLVVRLLNHDGYEAEGARDAAEANELLSTRAFDLLIADIGMPGNRDLELLREQGVIPILLVTGAPSLDSAVAALRGAAIDYLAKPVAPERLLARVADGIARARALRQLRATEDQLLELTASLRESLARVGVKLGQQADLSMSALPDRIAALLSPREGEVLLAFRAAPKIAEVAARLHISPHTVKNHIKAIFRKLEVTSQAEMLACVSQAERR
jgi:DNA-binding NarL/FixJ family response regulator